MFPTLRPRAEENPAPEETARRVIFSGGQPAALGTLGQAERTRWLGTRPWGGCQPPAGSSAGLASLHPWVLPGGHMRRAGRAQRGGSAE